MHETPTLDGLLSTNLRSHSAGLWLQILYSLFRLVSPGKTDTLLTANPLGYLRSPETAQSQANGVAFRELRAALNDKTCVTSSFCLSPGPPIPRVGTVFLNNPTCSHFFLHCLTRVDLDTHIKYLSVPSFISPRSPNLHILCKYGTCFRAYLLVLYLFHRSEHHAFGSWYLVMFNSPVYTYQPSLGRTRYPGYHRSAALQNQFLRFGCRNRRGLMRHPAFSISIHRLPFSTPFLNLLGWARLHCLELMRAADVFI